MRTAVDSSLGTLGDQPREVGQLIVSPSPALASPGPVLGFR